jgi:thiol-disulfide isomerase/thioredoxin
MKVIKINALWCPACLIMNNIFDKQKDAYQLEITTLDYDFDSEAVKEYNPGKILPVIIFLNDMDQEIKRIIGEKKEKEIITILEELKGSR